MRRRLFRGRAPSYRRSFNSRLREEATARCPTTRMPAEVSTHASVRRRPTSLSANSCKRCFNSRLREEATIARCLSAGCLGSFNSRLREEATFTVSGILRSLSGFNSRLREEATSPLPTSAWMAAVVSTHASVRRRPKSQSVMGFLFMFQLTPP